MQIFSRVFRVQIEYFNHENAKKFSPIYRHLQGYKIEIFPKSKIRTLKIAYILVLQDLILFHFKTRPYPLASQLRVC